MPSLATASATDTNVLLVQAQALARELLQDVAEIELNFALNRSNPTILPALFDILQDYIDDLAALQGDIGKHIPTQPWPGAEPLREWRREPGPLAAEDFIGRIGQ